MVEKTERSEDDDAAAQFVVFSGTARIASGLLGAAALAARREQDQNAQAGILVLNRASAEVVDLNLQGTGEDVLARYASAALVAKRGRPKLGVVPREVTLLPRHWDWLAREPGGASATLRRLVDAARKTGARATDARARTEAAYRFISIMAGDLAGFEEAARALFAGDRGRLTTLIALWPPDIRDEAARFIDAAWTADAPD